MNDKEIVNHFFNINTSLFKVGDRNEFLYDHPVRGRQHRSGRINNVYNAKKNGKAVFNIRDMDRHGEYRSFHHDRMLILSVG